MFVLGLIRKHRGSCANKTQNSLGKKKKGDSHQSGKREKGEAPCKRKESEVDETDVGIDGSIYPATALKVTGIVKQSKLRKEWRIKFARTGPDARPMRKCKLNQHHSIS